MTKRNKIAIVLSSLVTLLPILVGLILWDQLPDSMAMHWGADGHVDGFFGKAFAVFGFPFLLLLGHLVCIWITLRDQRKRDQNEKVVRMVFWIVPVVSLFTNGITYRVALGKEVDISIWVPALLGFMFAIMGNYFPKIKQNRTIGIKIPWTLNNEENWNRTHRFGGKVWVIGGIALLFSGFLPTAGMMFVACAAIVLMTLVPMLYSYSVYRQHQREGVSYEVSQTGKGTKLTAKITVVIIALTVVGVSILLFTGDLEVTCGDDSLQIQASYWTDLAVDYAEFDSVQYRKDLDLGTRQAGFGSVRLSMGNFRNEEFGNYTLYSYAGVKEHVVLKSGEKTLVIGMKDPKETREIYELLQKAIPNS